MATMLPSSIEDYNPTESERFLYNKLKEELPDTYRVFYSIRWFSERDGVRIDSESDFLILDPKFGYLCIEVKGGREINKTGTIWKLILSDNEVRVLNRSPYKQAEESMRFFKEYYEEQFRHFYNGIYGYAVAFPNFNIEEDFGPGESKILTLDFNDMSNLEYRIKEIFNYWRGKNRNFLAFSKEQREKFISLLHKRMSLSAAAGALIEYRNSQLEIINRVQDNYIDFLRNFNQAYITGGAGTGKTTALHAIADIVYELTGKMPVIMAPTAVAAFRAAEGTIVGQNESKYGTIHRLLKIITRETDEYVDTGEEKEGIIIDADFVIVDESSMLTPLNFQKLLNCITNKTQMVFAGDPNQLPPIKNAGVFPTLIALGRDKTVPNIHLIEFTQQFRSSLSLLRNAYRVLEGEAIQFDSEELKFIKAEKDRTIKEKVWETIIQLMEEQGIKEFNPYEILVLTPRNLG
ncbi:MAG: AAA family ATPase, partial [Tissierellia bacterium]|nr:AAA family ATPase [Tissierellia bacterium]